MCTPWIWSLWPSLLAFHSRPGYVWQAHLVQCRTLPNTLWWLCKRNGSGSCSSIHGVCVLWWSSDVYNNLSRGVGDADKIGQNQSLNGEEKSRIISCCLTPLTHVWCPLVSHFNMDREHCDHP